MSSGRLRSIIAALLSFAILSWLGTTAIYFFWTDKGSVYDKLLTPELSQRGPEVLSINGLAEKLRLESEVMPPRLILDAFVQKEWIVEFSVARTDNESSVAKQCSPTGVDGYLIQWEFAGDAFQKLEDFYGEGASVGCRFLLGFSETTSFAPFARNVRIDIPAGALSPLIEQTLRRGMLGSNVNMDAKLRRAMTERLSNEVAAFVRFSEIEHDLSRIAYLYGPIQFVTIALTIFSGFLIFATLVFSWARDAGEKALNLIPYVGFFGTLLGMGSALAILGDANLSDPLSKAINLGPIGSNLSLAIETTRLALVCFGLATLLMLVLDALRSSKNRQVKMNLSNHKNDYDAERESSAVESKSTRNVKGGTSPSL